MKKRAMRTLFVCLGIMVWASAAFGAGRILFVDSYHEGYFWSESVLKGAMTAIEGKHAEIEVIHMDTKRNTSEEFKKAAGLKVKERIDAGRFDVVIASDDNASKYVVMPYYKDANLPFVFCGVNWDASVYGYPYKNVTGMVEVSPLPLAIDHTKPHARGERIAVLAADTTTGHKNLDAFKNILHLNFVEAVWVNNFEDWKKSFLDMQKKADMLVISSPGGISGWNDAEAGQYILSHAEIPIVTDEPEFKTFAMLGLTKIPEEHGEYAANTALKILEGASPSDFPIVNSRQGQLSLNMKLAEKLGIKFPFNLVKMAKPENIIK
jgi:ABC-type uncharacterized transport system substrate-binding protein